MASEKIEFSLNTPTYQSRATGANLESCVNWYPETSPMGKAKIVLIPTPGTVQVAAIGASATAPIRGMTTDPFAEDERIWIVVGDTLYTGTPPAGVTSTGYVDAGYWEFNYTNADAGASLVEDLNAITIASIGTLTGIDTTTPIELIVNKDYVFIVALGNGEAWTYNKNTPALAKVTDLDYPFNQTPSLNINSATYQDGYFIVTVTNTEKFYISDLLDPTSWTATNFASAERAPDVLVKAINIKKELWLMGRQSTEVWYNSGNADFPFEPLPNANFDIGCSAPQSVQVIDDNLIFLARDSKGFFRVVRFQGFNYNFISNFAIENQLNKNLKRSSINHNIQTFGDNITAYSYRQNGHSFYVLTIPPSLQDPTVIQPQQGLTLVYDLDTDLWHEQKSVFVDATFGTIEGRHMSGETHAISRYKHYVGHYENNKLYRLSLDLFEDFIVLDGSGSRVSGTAINRSITSSYIADRLNRVFWSSLEVDVQQGTGGSLLLEFSDDQGQTYKGSVSKTIPTSGRKRIRWNRLGYSRDRVYRLSTSSPNNVIILNSYAEIIPGEN